MSVHLTRGTMDKAVISNRIYFKYRDKDHLKDLMSSLSYRLESKGGAKGNYKIVEIVKNYKLLPGGIISIPQGRQDLIPAGFELVDKRVLYPAPFPSPKFALREGQQVVYDEINDSCFINALVGWGK